jgi:hypothetical protein
MPDERSSEALKTFLFIALFAALGTPMVAYLWGTLNQVMALQFDPVRVGISIPILLVFIGFLILLARAVRRYAPATEPTDPARRTP